MSYDVQQVLAAAIPSVCMLALPIALTSKASIIRSIMTAVVIYVGFLLLSYLNL